MKWKIAMLWIWNNKRLYNDSTIICDKCQFDLINVFLLVWFRTVKKYSCSMFASSLNDFKFSSRIWIEATFLHLLKHIILRNVLNVLFCFEFRFVVRKRTIKNSQDSNIFEMNVNATLRLTAFAQPIAIFHSTKVFFDVEEILISNQFRYVKRALKIYEIKIH